MALAINGDRLPDWQGLEAFAKDKVAVDGGSFAAQILLAADNGRYRDNVLIRRNIQAALDELRAGAAVAVMGTRAELQAAGVTKAPYRLVDVSVPGAPLRSWAVGLAVKSERKELAARLDAALKGLQADGTVAAIFERHGVRNVQP